MATAHTRAQYLPPSRELKIFIPPVSETRASNCYDMLCVDYCARKRCARVRTVYATVLHCSRPTKEKVRQGENEVSINKLIN